jgi:manganese transport protein
LLLSGISASITSGMAAGSIFAGIYKEPYDIRDSHSRIGVTVSLVLATILIFIISNPFQGLILSQVVLSIQLPLTIFALVYLTSSEKVMGKYRNGPFYRIVLITMGTIVAALNVFLFISIILN